MSLEQLTSSGWFYYFQYDFLLFQMLCSLFFIIVLSNSVYNINSYLNSQSKVNQINFEKRYGICSYSEFKENLRLLLNIHCISILIDSYQLILYTYKLLSSRQMGQQQPNSRLPSARTYHYQSAKKERIQYKTSVSKQHQGILKLRSTPFPNCAQISNDGILLFLENGQTTLFELLQNRLYTNRLFPLEDVQRLIQNIVYTLAYLAESQIVYKDLSTQNIYYCNGMFKLLPNELIQQDFYDRTWENFYGLKNKQDDEEYFSYLSPQLVIALRMKQKQIQDFEILNKSTVFTLGFILLQATTLLPSNQCYDSTNYDIFNNIVSQRLDLVEEHYNQSIARIIANMIDYDFNQRMDLKQLSIWINRQLGLKNKETFKNFDTEQSKVISKGQFINKSRCVPQQPDKQKSLPQFNATVPPPPVPQQVAPFNQGAKGISRKNKVYITGIDQNSKQESRYRETAKGAKNYVYLESSSNYDPEYQFQKRAQEKYEYRGELTKKLCNSGVKQHFQKSTASNNQGRKYSYNYQNQIGQNYARNVEPYEPKLNRDYRFADKVETPTYGYSHPYTQNSHLKQVGNIRIKGEERRQTQRQKLHEQKQDNIVTKIRQQNRYYPSISEIENTIKSSEVTKRIPKNFQQDNKTKQVFESKQSHESQSSKHNSNDGSINRIKMEIEKSRKLIQEFRKGEAIQ